MYIYISIYINIYNTYISIYIYIHFYIPDSSMTKDQKTEITHQKFFKSSQNVEDIYQRCRKKTACNKIKYKIMLNCIIRKAFGQ